MKNNFMKQFLLTFSISTFLLACFFWEAGLLFSDQGLVLDIVTFLFFDLVISAIIFGVYKFFGFLKKPRGDNKSNEITADQPGKILKGLIVSFIIFVAVLIPEGLFYLIAGALYFVPMTITSPFLLSMAFSAPFLFLNFIFLLFNKGNTRRGLKYGFLLFLIIYVFIFGINLYIFVFQKEAYSYSQDIKALNESVQTGDQLPCDKLKSEILVARCLYEIAIQKIDVSFCDRIIGSSQSVNYYRDICYSETKLNEATKENDIKLCDEIKCELDKVQCIQQLATKNQKPEYCEVLEGTDYIDACYYGAVEKMTDKTTIAKYCSLMRKGFVHQQLCFKLIK
jgi:hypothetical protein